MSWLDHIEDRVNELFVALERIADALERIAKASEADSNTDSDPASRLHDLTTDDSENEPPDLETDDDFEV